MLVDAIDPKFRVGQRWSYRARPHESASSLTIVKIESDEQLGVIIHIGLAGLAIANPHAPSGLTETAAHLPFSRAAVEASVVALLSSDDASTDWHDGYEQWREAFTERKAGVFSLPVADAVAALERTFNV